MKLIVNEIFYSLQGEGGRTGEASIFIRLTKCNLNCRFCDTDFATGKEMSITEIIDQIKDYPCKWIVWTGGEPTIQLKERHLQHFRDIGYKQAIETNGTNPIPSLIDYIACSPKEDYEKVRTIIPHVNEIRIPIARGNRIPNIALFPPAQHYFLSPIFNNALPVKENIDYCVEQIKLHPKWKLSLQTHNLIHIP